MGDILENMLYLKNNTQGSADQIKLIREYFEFSFTSIVLKGDGSFSNISIMKEKLIESNSSVFPEGEPQSSVVIFGDPYHFSAFLRYP